MARMTALSEVLPELAASETFTHELPATADQPARAYRFVEYYCADPECDCREALLRVMPATGDGDDVAIIVHALDADAAGGSPEEQTQLTDDCPAGPEAHVLLHAFRTALREPAFAARLEAHYAAIKAALPPYDDDDDDACDHECDACDHDCDDELEDDLADDPADDTREFFDNWLPQLRERFAPQARSHKIGRNVLCPCGSGQKYKVCCAPKGLPAEEPPTLAEAYDAVQAALTDFLDLPRNHRWADDAGDDLDFPEEVDDSDDLRELADTVFIEYVLHDYVGPDGRSLGKRFELLASRRGPLPALIERALEGFGSERLRYVEVAAVRPGQDIELNDLTTAERLTAALADPDIALQAGDLQLVRLRAYDEETHDYDVGFTIPREWRADFEELLAELLTYLREEDPGAKPLDVFLDMPGELLGELVALIARHYTSDEGQDDAGAADPAAAGGIPDGDPPTR